jgi:hypothetical protein
LWDLLKNLNQIIFAFFAGPFGMTWHLLQAYMRSSAAGSLILMETSLSFQYHYNRVRAAECHKMFPHKLAMLDISEKHAQQMANDLFGKNTRIYY